MSIGVGKTEEVLSKHEVLLKAINNTRSITTRLEKLLYRILGEDAELLAANNSELTTLAEVLNHGPSVVNQITDASHKVIDNISSELFG